MKSLLSIILFLGAFASAFAQDKIYMTSGKIIDCKVIEVGNEEIKYKVSTEPDAASYAVKKIDILKIEFADGHVEKFQDELENPDLYKDNKKNAWKIDFMSPLFGSTILSYEHSVKPGFSLEGSLGFIGLGINNNEYSNNINTKGFLVKVGPRFMRTPDFKQGSLRYYHVLKGAYIQPQIIFGTYNADVISHGIPNPNGPIIGHEKTTYGALMITFGKQTVFSNVFLIDIYAGVGWGFVKTIQKEPLGFTQWSYADSQSFGARISQNSLPIAGTLGIKLGFLTK